MVFLDRRRVLGAHVALFGKPGVQGKLPQAGGRVRLPLHVGPLLGFALLCGFQPSFLVVVQLAARVQGKALRGGHIGIGPPLFVFALGIVVETAEPGLKTTLDRRGGRKVFLAVQ